MHQFEDSVIDLSVLLSKIVFDYKIVINQTHDSLNLEKQMRWKGNVFLSHIFSFF